jgi:glycosyltransferase involved in cell wall biosynthesis
MEEKYPWAKGKIFRVFNGVALDGFRPRERPHLEGAASSAPKLKSFATSPQILSVGRYVEKKGFDDLIEACRLLQARSVNFTCNIVGGGPLEDRLREQIAEADLQSHVHLLGPKPQDEVRRLLAAAQVFVLACVHEKDGGSDNLPTVIVEAMLASVPVISTPVAGVPEMIQDGHDGRLVPSRNPPALAQAIGEMLADPVAAEKIGQAARASATAKFAVEKTAGTLKHLLVERAPVRIPPAARSMDSTLLPPGLLTRFLRILDK